MRLTRITISLAFPFLLFGCHAHASIAEKDCPPHEKVKIDGIKGVIFPRGVSLIRIDKSTGRTSGTVSFTPSIADVQRAEAGVYRCLVGGAYLTEEKLRNYARQYRGYTQDGKKRIEIGLHIMPVPGHVLCRPFWNLSSGEDYLEITYEFETDRCLGFWNGWETIDDISL